MKDQKKAEEIAAARMQMLSPLLAEGLDPAKASKIKAQICEQNGISDRTLRRYLAQYRNDGFGGLKPKGKAQKKTEDAVPQNILDQAILLRREVPTRSVAQIIKILEWEGLVEPGQILPIGPNGAKKQVYLVTFIDDATRFVLHGEFYPTLDQAIVEDCFRQAVQKYGVPVSVYFDNGKQYRTKWMNRACSKMGIRLLYAKPYSPEATGKVERFNRVVDSFISEAALEKPQTLDKLNQLFWVWLDECYQNKPHSGLGDNLSPETAYRSDKKALKFIDIDAITNAFLHCEARKVDKAGCINFDGRKYEVGISFIGCTVDVVYDPADISELTIEYEGYPSFKAHELVIGERAGKRPKLPEYLQVQPAESSRLLAAAAKRNRKREENQINAVSYRRVVKAGEKDV